MQRKAIISLAASLVAFAACDGRAAVLISLPFTGGSDANQAGAVPNLATASVNATSISGGAANGFSSGSFANNAGATASTPHRFIRSFQMPTIATTTSQSVAGFAVSGASNLGVAGNNPGFSANANYFEFTVAPAAGYKLNMTTLTFDLNASGGDKPKPMGVMLPVANGTWTFNWFVRSSAGGDTNFATAIGAVVSKASAAGSTPATPAAWDNVTLSLTGARFQNLTTATTFRLFVYGTDNLATTPNLLIPGNGDGSYNGVARIDNIQLNGNLQLIPEPMTAGVIGLLAGVRLLRRSSRAQVDGVANDLAATGGADFVPNCPILSRKQTLFQTDSSKATILS
jgi:hypothetical protein